MIKQLYNIGNLDLDGSGMFWVTYYGDVPEQDGIYFGKGQIGFTDIGSALGFLQDTIEKNLSKYKNKIQDKTNE